MNVLIIKHYDDFLTSIPKDSPRGNGEVSPHTYMPKRFVTAPERPMAPMRVTHRVRSSNVGVPLGMKSGADDHSTREKRTKRALVAGAAGFIGSHLCAFLLARGYRVFAVDNLRTGQRRHVTALSTHPRFEFYALDITEPAFFHKFSAIHLDEIYNLACPTGVPNLSILAEEMLLTSSIGARNVLELARIHSAKLLFTSTAEIYGNPLTCPLREEDAGNVHPLGPRAAYEEGKRFAESLHAMYVRKYGVDARIVRVFNTYGPGMSLDDQRVIPQFVRSILTGAPLTIYGDGSQTRTHIYVDDQLEGFATVLKYGASGGVYNIGGTRQISIRELAETMLRITGAANSIVHVPHFIEDHARREPSVEKITALGWKPTVSLEQGIERMLEAHRMSLPSLLHTPA